MTCPVLSLTQYVLYLIVHSMKVSSQYFRKEQVFINLPKVNLPEDITFDRHPILLTPVLSRNPL